VIEKLAAVLAADPRIAYALLFGSGAKGGAHPESDLDVAIGVGRAMALGLLDLGALAARLEAATGRRVDLVVMDEAPPVLAYRIFRDGQTIVVRDKPALDARRARAILEYLDFRPVEQLCARGVLAAAHGR
jgi:predicted nucleotidyltransferase